jgi:hypothetical protein
MRDINLGLIQNLFFIFTPSLTLKDLNSKDKTHLVDKHVHIPTAGFTSGYKTSKSVWYKFLFGIIYAVYYFLFTIISLIGLLLVVLVANIVLLFRKKKKNEIDVAPVTF